MVRDYVTSLYTPGAASSLALTPRLVERRHLPLGSAGFVEAWSTVCVEHVESLGGEQVEVGTKIHVSALVRLGELTPDDIQVQLVTGRVSGDDRLHEPRALPDRGRCRRRATPVRELGECQACRRDRLHRTSRRITRWPARRRWVSRRCRRARRHLHQRAMCPRRPPALTRLDNLADLEQYDRVSR